MKKILIAGFLFILWPSISKAAGPVINFSDMTDGPTTGWEGSSTKGAAVSIWGTGFGTTRGSNYITVGGVNLTSDSDYAEWGATTNPTVPMGMRRITFFLNSSMLTGGNFPNTTIQVTVDGTESNTIPFHCRALAANHIYFLDDAIGLDSNDGLTVGTAKQTTAWARGNLQAGDVCYLKAGTYDQHDVGSGFQFGALMTFGGGTSPNHHNGSEGNSITITAYPGDNVVLDATSGVDGDGTTLVSCVRLYYDGSQLSYWTFSKFTMQALYAAMELGGTGFDHGGLSGIRIIGNDATTKLTATSQWGCIINAYGSGLGMNDFKMYGNYLHDQCTNYRGQDTGRRVYQVYIGGYGVIDRVDVGWNDMGWGSQGRGFQVYGHLETDSIDNLYVHDNWFHDNVRQDVIFGGGDGFADYAFVKNAWFYNNVLWNSGEGDLLLETGVGRGRFGGNYHFFNNTFYRNNAFPVVMVNPELDTAEFRNNIFVTLPNAWDYFSYNAGTPPAGVSGDHNLFYGAGADAKPPWDSSTLTMDDPLMVDPSNHNFSLGQTSPAKNAGATISLVDNDINGISRPQGVAYDIGAYEYDEGTPPDTTAPGVPGGLVVN